MKTIKQTQKTTIHLFFTTLLLIFLSVSCSDGEDGMDGMDGEQGPQGVAGVDGIDGADGADGADGNANVQNLVFDTSTETGTTISLTVPEITQSVLDNDVILSYHTKNGFTYQSPGDGFGNFYRTRTFLDQGSFGMSFIRNSDNTDYSIIAGEIEQVRIVIIVSTSTTNNRSTINAETMVLNELENAGVDVNDYYAVCDYYGIDY